MKKLLFAASLLAAMSLTSCGGPSGASGEQVDKAYDDWKEMKENLQQPVNQAATSVAAPDSAAKAVIDPADSTKAQ